MLVLQLHPREWHFVGCAGPEARSAAAAEALRGAGVPFTSTDVVRVTTEPDRFGAERERRVSAAVDAFQQVILPPVRLLDVELYGSVEPIPDLVARLVSEGRQHLAVDISVMPKRVFFPLIRRILEANAFETVLVLYSRPHSYPDTALAEDPDPMMPLPLFAMSDGEVATSGGIIAIGLEILGVSELLEAGPATSAIEVLMPIPSNADESRRLWRFMRTLKGASESRVSPPQHLSPLDCGEGFSFIRTLTDGFSGKWWLAPFGPKPLSLAMAVVGTQHNWPVFYSQPTVYNPQYSIGVGRERGESAVYGYLLIQGGEVRLR